MTRAGIFTRPVVALFLAGGIWSGIVNISLFAWSMKAGRPVEEAMAMTFVSLVLIQFFKAYSYRSDRVTVFRRPFANHWLNLAIGWELALLAAIVHLPSLQRLFTTFSFAANDWWINGSNGMVGWDDSYDWHRRACRRGFEPRENTVCCRSVRVLGAGSGAHDRTGAEVRR